MLEGYHLVDLRSDTEECIEQDKQAALAALLLKQGKLRDFYNWLEKYSLLLEKYPSPYAEEAFLYILSLDKREETFEKLKQSPNPKQKELIMSIAQKLTQQGMESKTLDIARNLLHKNMEVSFITETTGLDAKIIAKLKEHQGSGTAVQGGSLGR